MLLGVRFMLFRRWIDVRWIVDRCTEDFQCSATVVSFCFISVFDDVPKMFDRGSLDFRISMVAFSCDSLRGFTV
jgi:hypothetical protein